MALRDLLAAWCMGNVTLFGLHTLGRWRGAGFQERHLTVGVRCVLSATFCVLACVPIGQAIAGVDSGVAPSAPHAHTLGPGVGYVSLVRLTHQRDSADDGEILAVFERAWAKDGIPLYRSKDGGRAWSFVSYIRDQGHPGDPRWQLRWQPYLGELHRRSGDLATGTLLLATNATKAGGGSLSAAEDLELYVSMDDGNTWRYRSSIVKGGGQPSSSTNHGVWEPFILVLPNGRMVAYYSSEQHKHDGYNQVIAHKVSDDGGLHWGQEHLDVAIPGGVERPGMATVAHLPDGGYAMSYEDINGPHNGQVYVKFSRNGLNWGLPSSRGVPVVSAGGSWPAATPVIHWFPVDGPEGVIVVSAQRAGGGGRSGGQSFYWNNALGRGPWWEVSAPVHKRTGNIHAGWTQGLMLLQHNEFLHVTSSSSRESPENATRNQILYAISPLRFDRYQAEDAARAGAVIINDRTASNGRFVGLGADAASRLVFPVQIFRKAEYELKLRFKGTGFPAQPVLAVNGTQLAGKGATRADTRRWQSVSWRTPLLPGTNRIVVRATGHALDIDYLEVKRIR